MPDHRAATGTTPPALRPDPPATTAGVGAASGAVALDVTAWCLLVLLVVAIPVSIAASSILLGLLVAVWLGLLASRGVQPFAPRFFWPLAAYCGWTLLVTVPFSIDPATSLVEAKEILLVLVVPIVYRLARDGRASTVTTVILTVGAVTAVAGIVQYGIFEYDNLGRRPSGSMGHYMTYSGLLMLCLGVALSRVLFGGGERTWAALVMPALVVALALTLTRSAWVGTCVAVGLLLSLKDLRLMAAGPVVAGLLVALMPTQITERVYSAFDLRDPTNRDRLAMVTAGLGMIRDHPVTGVGPEMVPATYADYRPPSGVNAINPHLHNVPLQIAAERGLPALVLWGWFIVAVVIDLTRGLRAPPARALAAAGLAAVASMLTAGLFEYNFGDSEFLLLFLVLITLPGATLRGPGPLSAGSDGDRYRPS